MNKEHEDQVALSLIGQGDMLAFTTTFKRYYKPLVLFANSIVRDGDAAEDIVQAFFCKLWEERETLARVTRCKSYLYQSIKNCCQNYTRHRRVVATLLPPEETLDTNLLQSIIEEELYVELMRQVDRLPARCREIMLLKLQDMDTSMIAKTCRVSEETVRSQYRRGKTLLKEQLSPAFKESFMFPLLVSVMETL